MIINSCRTLLMYVALCVVKCTNTWSVKLKKGYIPSYNIQATFYFMSFLAASWNPGNTIWTMEVLPFFLNVNKLNELMRHFLLSLKPIWTLKTPWKPHFTVDNARERMKLSCIKKYTFQVLKYSCTSLQDRIGCLNALALVPEGSLDLSRNKSIYCHWSQSVNSNQKLTFCKPVLLRGLHFYLLVIDASSGTWSVKNHPSLT